MKAVRYHGPGDVCLEDVPEPGHPNPDEVVLQILAASICGTDASQYLHSSMIPLNFPHPVTGHRGPVTLGHEVVGRVIEKGANVEGIEVGERMVPGCGWWCGDCVSCRTGRSNICERYFLYGVHCHGGLAERALFPAKMCVRVPDECSDNAAVLAQPTAVALHACKRVSMYMEQSLALFGAGNIGTLLLAVLQAQGIEMYPLIAIDVDASRLATAMQLGATHLVDTSTSDPYAAVQALTHGRGVDLAIEATGMPSLVNQALHVLRPGGTLLQVGIPSQPVALSLGPAVVSEKILITSNGQICPSDLPHALALLTHTDLASRLHTYEIPFDRFFDDGLLPLVEHRAPGKVIILFEADTMGTAKN